MGCKVGLSEEARNDLGAAVRFIAVEGKNPEAALGLGHELLETALSLAILPRRRSPVRQRPGRRKRSHRYWLIFYQVNEAEQWVEVVRVWAAGKSRPSCVCPDQVTRGYGSNCDPCDRAASSETACLFVARLLDACDTLAVLPERYAPYRYAVKWRTMGFGRYLVFFQIRGNEVRIGHVRQGARRPFEEG